MEWSALSPDINPMERVWEQLPPMNPDQLETALREEWANLPEWIFIGLVRSRLCADAVKCQGVITVRRGGLTRYSGVKELIYISS